jgi:hypothetical protein
VAGWIASNSSVINANVTAANTAIATLQANVGSYQIYANANASSQGTAIASLATNANANTAAYLTTASITTTGNISAGNVIVTGNVTGPNLTGKTTGSWTVTTGTNTYSITVPASGTYQIWVRGNIPNGIISYIASAVVTNTNVPVVGAQYAWVYNGGGTPIDFTSIPNQFVGTANSIVRSSVAPSATTNRFDFGINNTSGSAQTVRYGWIAIS